MSALGIIAIGAGLFAIVGAGAALAMGLATGKAVDAVARQPEASGKINGMLIFGLIMMETTAIYGLVVSILLIFVMGGKVV